MKQSGHWLYAAVPLTAASFSAVLVAKALWIPAKAEFAQWLIARSWRQVLAGHVEARPWPWADTRPVGLLLVPRKHVRQVILEGNSGRNLAFGPVLEGSALAGADWVISGHRDTHFRFLHDMKAGDLVEVHTQKRLHSFIVSEVEIVDSRTVELIIEPGVSRLSLVTCYPFDSPSAGGPLRYVVTALPVDPPLSGLDDQAESAFAFIAPIVAR